MISAVVLTRNEEKNIAACLESLKWCDEIIVIDDHSNDKTLDICKRAGATIILHALEGDFAAQRNFGLEKAQGEWVLFVDADERVSLSLSYEILHVINESLDGASGYLIPRLDTLWGKVLNHGETGSMRLLRLAKKDAGIWQGTVHERWIVKGKVLPLKHSLQHFPHQSLSDFLEEVNYYTSIRAKELAKKKVNSSLVGIVLYPLAKFAKNYLIFLGFLDGIPGLLSATIMSFHSFLVRGKLWQLQHK